MGAKSQISGLEKSSPRMGCVWMDIYGVYYYLWYSSMSTGKEERERERERDGPGVDLYDCNILMKEAD